MFIDEKNNIENLFQENWSSYTQLCIELLDYLEELLNIVQVIFTSLDQSRSNSMTSTGQCHLNPLIICIEDSSLLYDYIVRILFKLHEGTKESSLFLMRNNASFSALPNEPLQNHRQRFIEHFRRLKRFYGQASMLQYFKNLIKVPILPEVLPKINSSICPFILSIESPEFQ